MDITSLLNSATGQKPLIDPMAIIAPLMPYIIGLTAIGCLIALLYIINAITTWRSHRAVIEMRNILRDMNQRDLERHTPRPTDPTHQN